MVDKVAARFMKTRDVSMFSLPLGVYHHFTGSIQLNVSEVVPSCHTIEVVHMNDFFLQAVHEHLLDLHTKVDLLNSDVVEESVSSRHSSPVTPAESPLLPVKSSRRTVLALLYFLQEVLSSKRLTAELQRARSTPDASPQRRLAEIMEAAVQLMGIEVNKLSQTDTAQLCACSQSLVKLLSRLMSTSEFVTNVKSLIGSSASEVSFITCMQWLTTKLIHRCRSLILASTCSWTAFRAPNLFIDKSSYQPSQHLCYASPTF